MQPKLILINGPARSGKDTALEAYPEGIPTKFARPVKEGTHGAFGLDVSVYHMDYFEDTKDEPSDLFFGQTPRAAYIAFSELFMKPFARDLHLFGKLAANWVQSHQADEHPDNPVYICTDSGFKDEAIPMIELFGPKNVFLIRVHRRGCTFAGDSRSYICLKDYGVSSIDIVNRNIDDYLHMIGSEITNFLEAYNGNSNNPTSTE